MDEFLLMVLQSRNILSPEMIDSINGLQGEVNKCNQLINYVLRLSKASLSDFLEALKETNQQHLTDYFTQDEGQQIGHIPFIFYINDCL